MLIGMFHPLASQAPTPPLKSRVHLGDSPLHVCACGYRCPTSPAQAQAQQRGGLQEQEGPCSTISLSLSSCKRKGGARGRHRGGRRLQHLHGRGGGGRHPEGGRRGPRTQHTCTGKQPHPRRISDHCDGPYPPRFFTPPWLPSWHLLPPLPPQPKVKGQGQGAPSAMGLSDDAEGPPAPAPKVGVGAPPIHTQPHSHTHLFICMLVTPHAYATFHMCRRLWRPARSPPP
jgi:hypothetical protein